MGRNKKQRRKGEEEYKIFVRKQQHTRHDNLFYALSIFGAHEWLYHSSKLRVVSMRKKVRRDGLVESCANYVKIGSELFNPIAMILARETYM